MNDFKDQIRGKEAESLDKLDEEEEISYQSCYNESDASGYDQTQHRGASTSEEFSRYNRKEEEEMHSHKDHSDEKLANFNSPEMENELKQIREKIETMEAQAIEHSIALQDI